MPKGSEKLTILAIETSCDETAAAVVEGTGGFTHPQFRILSSVVLSQIKLHAPFGGVVPNIAKREHIKNLPLVLHRALHKAGFLSTKFEIRNSKQISKLKQKIDCLAVTVGPGLEPALWASITFTQKLAEKWKLPVVAANHMEGHITSVLLPQNRGSTKREARSTKRFGFRISDFEFPAIALLVSGGHTELVLVKNWLDYKIVGQTLDDAAGEAFDKVARMLELGYPGGPLVSKLARTGNRYAFSFPRPMLTAKNFDFSFSGLKTAVLYTLRDLKANKTAYSKNDIAASFQDAVVDVLLTKTFRAYREYSAKSVIIGGGVAANKLLRQRFIQSFGRKNLLLAPTKFTGDNAAMIAASAYFHALKKDFTGWKNLTADATLSL